MPRSLADAHFRHMYDRVVALLLVGSLFPATASSMPIGGLLATGGRPHFSFPCCGNWLYEVDPDSGAVDPVGPFSADPDDFPVALSLAVEPGTRRLFGWNNDAGNLRGLTEIDPTTGVARLIGPESHPGISFGAMTFDADGQLWGSGNAMGTYRVDKATGAAEIVNNTLFGALALAPSGRFYGAQGSFLVVFSDIEVGFSSRSAVWPLRHADGSSIDASVRGLAFDDSGQLFGVGSRLETVTIGSTSVRRTRQLLWEIGPGGIVVERDHNGPALGSLVFLPEPSSWLLVLLGISQLGFLSRRGDRSGWRGRLSRSRPISKR